MPKTPSNTNVETYSAPRKEDQKLQPAILNSPRLQLRKPINLVNHYAGYGGNLVFARFAAWRMA